MVYCSPASDNEYNRDVMALLTRHDIVTALERLGQLAVADGYTLPLVIVGELPWCWGTMRDNRLKILMRCSFHHLKPALSVHGRQSLHAKTAGRMTGSMMRLKYT